MAGRWRARTPARYRERPAIVTGGVAYAARGAGTFELTGSYRPALGERVGDPLNALPVLASMAGILGSLLANFVAVRWVAWLAIGSGAGLFVLAQTTNAELTMIVAPLLALVAFFVDRALVAINAHFGEGTGAVAVRVANANTICSALATIAVGAAMAALGLRPVLIAVALVTALVGVAALWTIPSSAQPSPRRAVGLFVGALRNRGFQRFNLINMWTRASAYANLLLAVLVLADAVGSQLAGAIALWGGAFAQLLGVPVANAWRRFVGADRERRPSAARWGPDCALAAAALLLVAAWNVSGGVGAGLGYVAIVTSWWARIANNQGTQKRVATGDAEQLTAQRCCDGLWWALSAVWPTSMLAIVGPAVGEPIAFSALLCMVAATISSCLIAGLGRGRST